MGRGWAHLAQPRSQEVSAGAVPALAIPVHVMLTARTGSGPFSQKPGLAGLAAEVLEVSRRICRTFAARAGCASGRGGLRRPDFLPGQVALGSLPAHSRQALGEELEKIVVRPGHTVSVGDPGGRAGRLSRCLTFLGAGDTAANWAANSPHPRERRQVWPSFARSATALLRLRCGEVTWQTGNR